MSRSVRVPVREQLRRRARTVGALALLQITLPADLAVTGLALLRSSVAGRTPRPVAERPLTVLVSGGKMTKALTLARAFHRAGHRVVLVEQDKYRWTGHRFSRCVDAFHTVPRPQDPAYGEALLDVVRREGVDVYVPVCSPAASHYDALAKPLLEPHCRVLHGDVEDIDLLDDKEQLARMAEKLGLPVPDSHRITSPDQVTGFDFAGREPPYVLKSIPYDPVHRLDLTPLPRPTTAETEAFVAGRTIDDETPWILQSLLTGREFCTHATARDGRVLVWACCPSSAFQVNYEMVDKPEIEAWVRGLIEPLGLTGQYSFDVIETDDGRVLPIECNPRTHSAITMFADHPGLAAAYLDEGVHEGADEGAGEGAGPLVPTAASRPTYWSHHELWRLLRDPRDWRARWRTVREGTDAIFDADDPLPHLMVHHLQIPVLLLRSLRAGTDWIRIDFNIGKLVEPAGD